MKLFGHCSGGRLHGVGYAPCKPQPSNYGQARWRRLSARFAASPLVLITLGISGAWISQLTALEPYRPIFIGVMALFLGLAFRQLYIVPDRCAPGEACANPRLQRRQRHIFWVVVMGLAALIAFPWYAPLLLN
jgi:mercuric ion transport protein